jgi:head-tail adaptor
MHELSGRLSERVTIEAREGAGAMGQPDWRTLCTRWALVEPLDRIDPSGPLGETRISDRRWRVTVRAGPAVSLDMRLRWRGLVLRLEGIEADPARPDRLVLLARQQGA